jgi:hypothetical protein
MRGEGRADAAKTTTASLAHADRLRGHTLQELRGGLDADGQGRGRADNLLARPGAGARRYDELRPLRDQAGGLEARGAVEQGPSFKGLSAVLRTFYDAKIEAVRRIVPARERAAAVRVLLDDRAVALRVLTQMRAVSVAATQQRRKIVRAAKRQAKDLLKINTNIIRPML